MCLKSICNSLKISKGGNYLNLAGSLAFLFPDERIIKNKVMMNMRFILYIIS